MTTLNLMRPLDTGQIVSIGGDGPVAGRLMTMGMLPGASIRVLGVAPLGDPMLVDVNGCRMSLRKHDAAALQVDCGPSTT